MTRWEFVKQLDKQSFAKWLVGFTVAINGIEEPAEEDYNDLIELTYRMLDDEVGIKTCKHHDISRED
jgi:hypothetical protein